MSCIASTLSIGLTGGTWCSSNSAIANIHAATGLLTGISTGTANLTYTASPGCYNIIVGTVNATVASITGAATVAVAGTTTLASTTGGGTWSSSNTTKTTVGVGTGVVTGVGTGTATITYKVSTGCYKTRSITVAATRPAFAEASADDARGGVIKVYPNPTSGTLTIESTVAGLFTLYTIDGKQVVHYAVTTTVLPYPYPTTLQQASICAAS